MAKIRIIILTIISTLIILFLFSCGYDESSNNTSIVTDTDDNGNVVTKDISETEVVPDEIKVSFETREEYGYIEGQSFLTGYIAYGDYVFDAYSKGVEGDILFKNINDLSLGSASIFFDPLSGGSGLSSFGINGEIKFMLIDEYETERNGGVPVFVLLINSFRENDGIWEQYGSIIKYNMKTRKVTEITDELPALVESLSMFGEYFYIKYNNGDHGGDIWRIDLNGNIVKMDNPEGADYMVGTVNENYIYVIKSHGNGSEVCRLSHDFKNEKIVATSLPLTPTYSYGNDVYFYKDKINSETVNGINAYSSDLLKVSDNGEGSATEYIESALAVFEKKGVLYYIGYGPRYYGSHGDNTNNIIYSRDLKNDKADIVADFSEETNNKYLIKCIYGRYMTLEIQTYSDDKSILFPIAYRYCCFDLETGELTEAFCIDVDPETGTFTFR